MRLRSMLFVPGDSERKFAKGSSAGADALILDLEDAVVPSMKDAARAHVSSLLDDRAERSWRFFVRVNPFDTGMTLDDMAAVVKPGLDGLLIPKANSAQDLVRIGAELDRLENKAGMAAGTVQLAVVATETAQAMFNLGSYVPAHPRLVAMTWGAEDLAAAIGATDNKEEDGSWTFPYQVARAQCLFAATAADALPIDTLYADFRDPQGLAKDCARARRDGFVGRVAIHPDQVGIINRAFSPTPEQVAHAQAIVDAFAASPDAGTLGINGKMYDIPHLKAARRTLAGAV
ncbi:CoA ester lyase [Sphingobium sp. CR2-8]|uniref:HpcH/HpaI aldolase/citrate lyase family protein n=1 Tax=Sphingobium sp. CR2-8 TaxID=1306534 RepID=UPI002DB9CF80|nr:CoA ester lyase [Sphingobium sp. CR2-8]MEC3909100.1 CoA ester lyase [Sphingobium sp. CR2-8]